MNNYLALFARNIGVLGILLSFSAMVARLLGYHRVMNFEAVTLLLGGIALMAASCVIQLNFLNKR
jgi:hypothetical protein